MIKRAPAVLTAGLFAGAVLVGAPGLPLAGYSTPQELGLAHPLSDTSTMMSSDDHQQQMVSAMSEMMADPNTQGRMRSMMSDDTNGMDSGGHTTSGGDHPDHADMMGGMHDNGENSRPDAP